MRHDLTSASSVLPLRREGRALPALIAAIAIAILLLLTFLIVHAQGTRGSREVRVEQETPAPQYAAGPNDYYVTGSVVRNGIYSIRPGSTVNVKQAIAAAGGINSQATTITVTRRDAGGSEIKMMDSVDTQQLLTGKHPDMDLRGSDLVYVAPPVTGEYYMDGDIKRTGVYSLSARKISLRQALAAAGGLDDGAKDAFVEIIRRQGDKSELIAHNLKYSEVVSANGAVIYLQPNDVIRVTPTPTQSPATKPAATRQRHVEN